ncbi:TraB/GumN family protein [Sphingomonas lutea]
MGLLAAAPLAPAQAKAPAPKPALWAVSDSDTTVYLFGTIHLLPDNYAWRTPRFEQAVAGSQQLVVETIVDESNPHEMLGALAGLGFSKGQPPITARVPAAKRAALEAAIAKSGIPRANFDGMETWAAAFMLLGTQFREMGLKTGQGVEPALRTTFTQQGKTVGQLETNRDQLSFFDALPEPAQRALLEGAIEPPQDMSKEFQAMVAAWSRGDVQAIARTFNEQMAASPALQEILMKRRNANWKNWVQRRMATPGSVMVAVGAGHLAGRDSLIDMLKDGGFKVRRVQ